jgi:hypothetical protein
MSSPTSTSIVGIIINAQLCPAPLLKQVVCDNAAIDVAEDDSVAVIVTDEMASRYYNVL